MKNIILETERLLLRKPAVADFEDLHEGVDNMNVAKHISSMPHPYSLENVRDYYGANIKKWDSGNPKDILFVIELKSEEKVIGCFGIHDIDYKNETANTGSWINEKYWRNGYMTEAKIAGNTFAFNELGLEKLVSHVFTDNVASDATQKKMGYEFDETKKDDCKCLATGEMHDVNYYHLTKSKWNIVLAMLKNRDL